MLFGNLRGIREAGPFFAIPTYFYVGSLSLVMITGFVKATLGGLQAHGLPPHQRSGIRSAPSPNCSWDWGSSTACGVRQRRISLTGLEAVSDGISSFRAPLHATDARRL